jgi:hypothetical protein
VNETKKTWKLCLNDLGRQTVAGCEAYVSVVYAEPSWTFRALERRSYTDAGSADLSRQPSLYRANRDHRTFGGVMDVMILGHYPHRDQEWTLEAMPGDVLRMTGSIGNPAPLLEFSIGPACSYRQAGPVLEEMLRVQDTF